MQNPKNFDLIPIDPIGNDIRRARNDQLAGPFAATRAPDLGMETQSVDVQVYLFCQGLRSLGTVLGNVKNGNFKILQRLFRPPYSAYRSRLQAAFHFLKKAATFFESANFPASASLIPA